MPRPGQKDLMLRMDKALFERFYRKFPGKGERKLLIERFIEHACELAAGKDAFIEGVLQEARERYGEGEEEG